MKEKPEEDMFSNFTTKFKAITSGTYGLLYTSGIIVFTLILISIGITFMLARKKKIGEETKNRTIFVLACFALLLLLVEIFGTVWEIGGNVKM